MTAPTEDLPLSDSELDRLADFLFEDNDFLNNLERLDGYYTALICGPDLALPAEYLPEIVSGGFIFDSHDQREEISALLLRHRNALTASLAQAAQTGGIPDLLFMAWEDGAPMGCEWALGFLHGVEVTGGWDELEQDELVGEAMMPILALAFEAVPPETEEDRMLPPLIGEDREQILYGVSVSAVFFYQYFRTEQPPQPNEPIVYTEPKIGRNEQCPCGSGKKFKHCCAH